MNAQTPAVTFEAVQERLRYRDGAPIHRQALNQRGGDWRMGRERVAREHATLAAAEKYARRILGQRPGVPVEIFQRGWHKSSDRLVAIVQRDALGRTWCDLQVMEPLL